jgi:regulator of protease activity HflC (stomatin/prohibitin superfamily)
MPGISMTVVSLSVEILLAVLLLIAIAYCMKLDNRLKAIRTGKDRMLEAAQELAQSVVHAQAAVTALRASADAAGRDLQRKIDETRAVAAAPAPAPVRERDRESVDYSLRRRSVL